jgi:hypothetical protein
MANAFMPSLRRRALRYTGIGLLLALLAVPFALSGHHHGPLQAGASDACSLCATLGHAAATSLQALPQIALLEREFSHQSVPTRASARAHRVAQPARGPPRPALSVIT